MATRAARLVHGMHAVRKLERHRENQAMVTTQERDTPLYTPQRVRALGVLPSAPGPRTRCQEPTPGIRCAQGVSVRARATAVPTSVWSCDESWGCTVYA